jgi:hypothetical protein
MAFKMPMSFRKHALVGPGGNDFADEQVVPVLIVRLGQQAALEPRRATFQQRCIDSFTFEGLQPIGLELVEVTFPGNLKTRGRADRLDDIDLTEGRHVDHERPRTFE